jgi:hypothetical protein
LSDATEGIAMAYKLADWRPATLLKKVATWLTPVHMKRSWRAFQLRREDSDVAISAARLSSRNRRFLHKGAWPEAIRTSAENGEVINDFLGK